MSILSDALALLEAMKGADWESQFELYSAALDRLPEGLILPAVQRLAGETWRPAPFEILREAARMEMARQAGTSSAFPSADEAYGEILHKIREFGANGRTPYPDRPNLRMAGAPPFSHPLVAATVMLIGGWEFLCSGEAGLSEGLSKQVKAVYDRQAAQWVDRAVSALCAGEAEGAARRYFPRGQPREPLPALSAPKGRPARIAGQERELRVRS